MKAVYNCSKMVPWIQEKNPLLMHFSAKEKKQTKNKLRASKKTLQLSFHALNKKGKERDT